MHQSVRVVSIFFSSIIPISPHITRYYLIYVPALCVPSPPPPVSPPTPPMICFKSANSHRDQPRQGRHPRNCRRFWSRKASILVTVVTFGPSCCRCASKVPTVTGIGVVLIAILRTVSLLTPHAVVALQMYQQIISALYSLRQNFRHFWPLMFLSRFRCIDRSTITDISLL